MSCVHWWVCAPPNGRTSEAKCKRCKAKRTFHNSEDDVLLTSTQAHRQRAGEAVKKIRSAGQAEKFYGSLKAPLSAGGGGTAPMSATAIHEATQQAPVSASAGGGQRRGVTVAATDQLVTPAATSPVLATERPSVALGGENKHARPSRSSAVLTSSSPAGNGSVRPK